MSRLLPNWSTRFGWPAEVSQALNSHLGALPGTGDLAEAIAGLAERAAEVPEAAAHLHHPDVPAALARLAYAAPFLLRHLTRHPRSLSALTDLRAGPPELPWPRPEGDGAPTLPDEGELMRRLRKWKYENYVRLTARDLLGLQDTAATCSVISGLADTLIAVAYRWAFANQAMRLGLPLRADGALAGGAVLAMGKLGGREVNYASDVDLIFVQDGDHTPCRRAGGWQPPDPGPGPDPDWWKVWVDIVRQNRPLKGKAAASGADAGGGVTSEEFHYRLAQQVTRLLSTPNAEGIGFRVDCDLRPHGRGGFLAPRVAAMEQYYAGQGREWERAAMIKARVVLGSGHLARRLKEIIRPFVYRRYLDYSALEGVAIVKHDIDRVHHAALERNIKLGRGGIRENEFVVQSLQLLHGGRIPGLQVAGHEESLNRLVEAGILSPDEGAVHLADYWLLRTVENRLQMVAEAQTHDLPQDGGELTRVLHDFQPAFEERQAAARAALDAARDRNEERFRALFRGRFTEPDTGEFPDPQRWREAVAEQAPPSERQAVLERVDAAFSRLMTTRAGERCVFKLSRLLSREEIYLSGTEPALPRWLEFIEQIGNRNALYGLLESHPAIVPWVGEIFREGGRQARALIRHPEFLESFFALGEQWETLASRFADIAAEAPDEETFILELQNNKARDLIRVLTAYLNREDGSHRERLSELADATVTACTRFAWRMLCHRLGTPRGCTALEPAGFSVLALGKLGGREMRFSSDLDLVFVYGEEGETGRGVSHSEFFTRLTQKIGTLLTSSTLFGRLYELDHRLRPFGGKGLLVPSLAAYRSFLDPSTPSGAEVWNFQAFTRIRPVVGDASLAATLIEAIHEAWRARALPPAEVARQVERMLGRLVAGHGHGGRDRADGTPLKYAVGGLLGYEFFQQAHFLISRAGSASGWTVPPPHEIMDAIRDDSHAIGALDERLSLHESDGLHVLRPAHASLAAIAARWNFAEVKALCSRMETEIVKGFRAWSG